MGGTGLYHIRRKWNSSGRSLGRRSLVSAARKAEAAAEAMKKRRFSFAGRISLFSRRIGQALVYGALLGGFVRLPHSIVDTGQMIAHAGFIRIDGCAALQLRCGD